MDSENDERGALVLKQDAPLYGRMTLLVSDAFTFDVTETQQGRSRRGRWICIVVGREDRPAYFSSAGVLVVADGAGGIGDGGSFWGA